MRRVSVASGQPQITIGTDAHKRVHAAVARDDAGGELAQWRGPNRAEGWRQVAAWAALGPDCRWGLAGAWNDGRGLAQFLVEAGVVVHEVNPRWTAQRRRTARTRGKRDRLDARAVAPLVRGAAGTLPAVAADGATATRELLVTERDAAVAEATRRRNQVQQVLLHRDPEYPAQQLPKVRTKAGLCAPERDETADRRPLQQRRAGTVRRLAQRLRLAQEHARFLAAQIRGLAAPRFAPLAQICGSDLLTAGTLAGILGPGRRCAADAPLAAYVGAAPPETAAAERVRYRLNRGGNRRLNAIR